MSDLKAVRRYAAQHDLFNRLHSISADEQFVRDVAHNWFDGRFEVVPNQRCGNWYCDPSTSSKAYAYFKSTDGHMTQWDFNLRRSNLNLAKYAEDHGGLILVDSTRRGKRMPDGLSKTVPIWCCVINLALELRRDLSVDDDWDSELYLPPKVVSPSEKAQIEERLDVWAEMLEKSSLSLPNLSKPLRPFFIHPSTSTPPVIPSNPPYTPIICLSASRWANDLESDDIPSVTRLGDSGMSVGFDYVPGAGDDDELWARGLKPTLFHANKADLLQAERDDLPTLVDDLITSWSMSKLTTAESRTTASNSMEGIPGSSSRLAVDLGTPISPTGWDQAGRSYLRIRVIEYEKYPRDLPRLVKIPRGKFPEESVLIMGNPKTEAKAFEQSLAEIVRHIQQSAEPMILVHGSKDDVDRILKYSETQVDKQEELNLILDNPPPPTVEGRRLILPILLAVISSLANLEMTNAKNGNSEQLVKQVLTKSDIANKLHGLVSQWPDGNPPRSALKRVNEFLMSDGKKQGQF
ncbi:uncharacterized protein I206_103872 [Kwoniella pini CBS 10737]|uniref:tRNA '-O-ribosylphosphate transferase n=1 Tax=Kwoniella pini CBS 10737 TaxID=1296096 RepID=A0A1B9I3D3_9TREE|nr:uncharacterized protein I206_04556 [Kwoniella pini CBS 10737]OCF50025.1 hypothetical protein I206_04556 [Kwoniella pini CBS 10737]